MSRSHAFHSSHSPDRDPPALLVADHNHGAILLRLLAPDQALGLLLLLLLRPEDLPQPLPHHGILLHLLPHPQVQIRRALLLLLRRRRRRRHTAPAPAPPPRAAAPTAAATDQRPPQRLPRAPARGDDVPPEHLERRLGDRQDAQHRQRREPPDRVGAKRLGEAVAHRVRRHAGRVDAREEPVPGPPARRGDEEGDQDDDRLG
ncbi:uncharacterized protein E0L32_012400, partial [Thyridium curvatum]